ncbi:hypothetical protein BRC82_09655 [Halobacteriales archaeon QS_1_67_19]|nr:MAG: hypothetical protein BRC82_09655 [Halobacteriales archaeon QS_1_67_19]
MVRESTAFGLSTLVIVVGLAIMLYGIKLTAGIETNSLMLIGGGVVLAAVVLHTAAIMTLDSGRGAA